MKVKNGFSIVFALGLMSVFAVIVTIFLSSAIYLHELSLARQKAEYHYWATVGLIEFGKTYLGKLVEQTLHISHWPRSDSSYAGKIQLSTQSESVVITAQLIEGKQIVYTLTRQYPVQAQIPSIAL